jgi:hypothetical protein
MREMTRRVGVETNMGKILPVHRALECGGEKDLGVVNLAAEVHQINEENQTKAMEGTTRRALMLLEAKAM